MAKKEATMDILLENTIALQKTLASLASELKALNKKVSELFELFESASAAFREAGAGEGAAGISSDIADKIDTLVEQNKTLAKGLLLLEQAVRERKSESPAALSRPSHPARPVKPLRKRLKQAREEEAEEEAGEEVEASESEEYKAQPLPEFSF